mgnify:FL=1
MKKKLNVGVLIFNQADVPNFAGPFEVFAICSELQNRALFNVFTVAKTLSSINAVNGLSVKPSYSFLNVPKIDVLIISGGAGTRRLMADKKTLNWINKIHKATTFTLSFCSGARLLAVLNLLDSKPYCTHRGVYNHLKEIVSNGIPKPKKRFVQSSEKIFTSEGISAGIDMSLHIIELLYTKTMAKETEHNMEYKLESIAHNTVLT